DGHHEHPTMRFFPIHGIVDIFDSDVVAEVQSQSKVEIVTCADGNRDVTVLVFVGDINRTAAQETIVFPFAVKQERKLRTQLNVETANGIEFKHKRNCQISKAV